MINSRRAAAVLASLIAAVIVGFTAGCGDSSDLLGLALDPPSRQPIDRSRVGVNNFFVDREFGSIPDQFNDIRNNLGLRFVRVLFAWTDGVQPSPNSPLNYSFYDSILSAVPPGTDVLVVLVHTPSWMANSANWIDGDPRRTWVERWVQPTVSRYAGVGSVIGFEVWNEPDRTLFASDAALELENPDRYFELLRESSQVIRRTARNKRVLNAATESIQQSFPDRLRYNRRLVELGAQGLVDVWNIHYYGSSFESVVTSNGVADFLNDLGMPVWVTESGETGPTEQLAFAETTWPFLLDEIPSIERFYYYQYGETVQPVSNNFGLRTTDSQFPVSDLYVFLRDGQ